MGEVSLEIIILAILIPVCAGFGLLAGYFLGHHKGKDAAHHEAEEELDRIRQSEAEAQGQISVLTSENASLKAKADSQSDHIVFVEGELAKSQQAEQQRVARENERKEALAETKRLEQEQRLKEQAKVMAALSPVSENLKALQLKVAQIEEGRKQEMGALGEQLKGLNEQQLRLDKQTNSLSQALTNNKVRGAWGEAQLRNIVESAGLREHVDFDMQVVVDDKEGNRQRPDMVVHLPGGKSIPIDAKVPYADYQRACEIPQTGTDEDNARRASLLNSHAKALRDHVKVLSDKAYWNAFEAAPDFVVAFIPNEALLQAALETDPTLLDDAFARKVALTSPVTLWAVLKSVSYAWQQQNLTDDAKKMFDLSKELYSRLAKLGEHATALGTQLTKTVRTYNGFVSSLESRVLPTARKLKDIDPTTVIPEMKMLEAEDVNIRELTAPEFVEESDEPEIES